MSKRKPDGTENYQISNKKTKRLHEDCFMNACLQTIDDDIAYIIVDFLKLSATSLSALSLTCSRWHNQIDAILNKYMQRYLPLSYKGYRKNTKRRYEVFQLFSSLQSEASVDLQLFEFQEKSDGPSIDSLRAYVIPWAQHIVLLKSFGGFAIVDLNQGQFVVQFAKEFVVAPTDLAEGRIYPLCAINEKRKQVVISSTLLADYYYQENDNDNSEDEEYDSEEVDYHEWLFVYNVSDNGAVDFVTKFCVKNEYAVAHFDEYDGRFHAPPNLHLDSNGIIWHSVAKELRRFSIDNNVEEIETDFDLNGLSVIGIGELDDEVMLFCSDYKSRPISVFDTSLNEFVGDLPESESMMSHRAQKIEMKVVVRNNLALVTSHHYNDEVQAIYNLKPLKKLYLNIDSCHCLSPSGNKIARLYDDQLEICTREDDQVSSVQSFDTGESWLDFSLKRKFFWWIDDERLFGIRDGKISILDKSLKYYTLPFKSVYYDDLAIVGGTILIADISGREEGQQISIYRLKM